MSSDLVGCFALRSAVDTGQLLDFMSRMALTFKGASSRFRYDEDFLAEEATRLANWGEVVADMNSSSASLNASFAGDDYRFSLGFFADSDGQRYSFFTVSGRYVEKMADALEERATNYLGFFIGLRASLNATAMAFGMDVDNVSLIAFLNGKSSLAEVDEFISTAAGVAPRCAQALLTNPNVREINIAAETVLSRWLPGLDAYFKTK